MAIVAAMPTGALAHVTPFSESYSSESTAEGWKNLVEGRYTPAILQEDGDYYLSIKQDERSTGTVVTGTSLAGKAAEGDNFTLSFDMRLGSSGGGRYAQYPTSVSFMDAANSGIVFSLVAKGPATGITGPGWKVNNTDLEIDLPNSGYTYTGISQITWCSYLIVRWKGLTFVTITNRETGEVILPRQMVEGASTTGGLGNIVFDLKRYRSNFALDNIVLRGVVDEDVAHITPVTYTLRYRNEENVEIKADSTITSYVGAEMTASPMQLHPIMHDGQKYLYKEGNKAITLTEDATTNVITLTYRKAAIYNYTVNAVNSQGEVLKNIRTASGFEADNLIIPFPTYVVKDEKMWSTEAAYAEYREHVTLTQDNQVVNIVYSATTTSDVVYYAEAEDVEGMTRYSAGNSEVRSSQAAMGYAEKDVRFTTLEPGNYQLSFVLYAALLNQERSMTFTVGSHTFTHTASGINFSLRAFPVFTITEPTDLILKQGGDESYGVDLVYVQRVDGEPQFIAELNAADSTLTFKKGFITNNRTLRGWEATDTGDRYPGWYSYRNYYNKVVFDESFAEARPKSCRTWFYANTRLKSVEGIEHLNTSEVTDMRWMFSRCSGLSSLDVSHFDTQNVTSMKSMFGYCNLLGSLDVSHFDTSNVTDMSYMFNECQSLTSLDVSHFNTSNVTDMTGMFRYCTQLTTIDVSDFNTSNVKNLGWLFCGCFSLENVDVSKFKTDKATIMTSMFWNCHSLKDIDVTSFNTDSVTSMGWMFVGCSSLKTLNLSSFNTANVKEMKYMLAYCSELTTIFAGKGWDASNVTSGDSVFYASNRLVGGMGTCYDDNNIDHRYARIDGGTDAPGYFTDLVISGISNVRRDDELRGPVYGIDGRRVTLPGKGIYIFGRKKVVVK